MAPEERGAMFDEFVQGAGRLDDVDITIKSARFSQWDYKGKVNPPVLALKIEAEDSEGQVHEEFLSSGDLKYFVPSSDGKKAIPVGSQTKLNINTNAVAFLISIMNADTRGELAAKLRAGDDISVLDGLRCHAVQKAQPKRAGIVAAPGVATAEGKTQLIIERINAYPWETGAVAATPPRAAAAVAAPAATAAAGGNGGAGAAVQADTAVTDMALGVLVQIIQAEASKSVKKTAIAGKVFSNADMKKEAAPVRNAVLGVIVQDAFLQSPTVQAVGITFDPATGTVSMPG